MLYCSRGMKSLTVIVDVNCLLSFWDMLFKGVVFSRPGRRYGVNRYSTYSTLPPIPDSNSYSNSDRSRYSDSDSK